MEKMIEKEVLREIPVEKQVTVAVEKPVEIEVVKNVYVEI